MRLSRGRARARGGDCARAHLHACLARACCALTAHRARVRVLVWQAALEGLDYDALATQAAQERGIIFVDEIDKLVRRDGLSAGGGGGGGAVFSKGEGVQKELLALLEGTSVRTRRGSVSTSHMLFILSLIHI